MAMTQSSERKFFQRKLASVAFLLLATVFASGQTMQQLASDNFNRANATTLGSAWATLGQGSWGINNSLQIISDEVEGTALNADSKELYYGGINWPPDQYSEMQIVAMNSANGGRMGPAVRMASNETMYICLVRSVGTGSATVQILLDNVGHFSTLASSSSATVSAGDTVRCTVQGSSITMTDQTSSTTLLTATDSTITGGYPGIVLNPGSGSLSDQIVANWDGGASAVPATRNQLAMDDFDRADSPTLGSNWTTGIDRCNIEIVSDQIQPGNTPAGCNYPAKEHYTAISFPSDQWSEAQIISEGTGSDNGPELRYQSDLDEHYICDVQNLGGAGVAEIHIAVVVAQSSTTIGTATTIVSDAIYASISPNDYVIGQAQGSVISCIDSTSGSLLLSAYDSTVTGGYPGWSLNAANGTPIAANWSGGGFNTASLVSIAVTPPNVSITKGMTQQYTATGTYSDNSQQNLTNAVTWTSSNTGVATITTGGLATGVGTGSTTIGASLGSINGSTGLTVNPAVLVSIAVTPMNASIIIGGTQQYTATGTYSDSSQQNLTSAVTWTSSNTGVATITTGGLATGAGIGTTTIGASLGSVNGSTGLTVTSTAVLISIAVTPTNPSVAIGATQQFTAIGTYSDTSQQNLTSSVTWTSSSTSVATISSTGLATSVGTGSTTIQASLGSINGSTTLTVAGGQFVQGTAGDNGAASSETTYLNNVASGDLLLVFSHWDNQSLTASATDSAGNTYVPISGPIYVGAVAGFQAWYAKNIKGATNLGITVTYSGTTTTISLVDAAEYSGLDTSAPLDVFASAQGTGVSQDSGPSPTTTANNETIIGLLGYYASNGPYTPGTSFTQRLSDATSLIEDQSVTATGSYHATGRSTASGPWAAYVVCFKNAFQSLGIYSPANGSTLTSNAATFSWYAYPGATAYYLDLGASQGSNTYLDSGSLSSTTLSYSVTSLPTDGSTVWARWYYFINGGWQYTDYNYTASGGIPGGDSLAGITSPAPSSTLTGSSATFSWSAGVGPSAYWLDVGNVAGGNQYYQSGSTTAQTVTVNGLPTDGSTVYVTLYSLINGSWQSNPYTYTAFNASSSKGVMQTPTPGSTLTGSSMTFTWSAGSGASGYWVDIGNVAGGNQYYESGNLGTVLTTTVNGLPTDGSTLYVTLYTLIGGSWVSNSYTYTAFSPAAGAAVMQTPSPGSTLTGSSVTFTWSAGSGANAYWLDIGNVAGGNQYYQSGNLGSALTTTANGLPTNGSTVYVTLYSLINGSWVSNPYSYTASSPGAMQTPSPGSVLAGSSVMFTWSAGSGATGYWVDIGNVAGGNQYYQSGNLGTVLTTTVNGLPTDGSTVYVTLYSLISGSWVSNSYSYTAFNASSSIGVMQTPTPGSTLTANSVTFTWSAGSSANAYWLDIGTSPGGNTIYTSGDLGNVLTTTAPNVQPNGNTVYVTLYSMVGGQWVSNSYTYTAAPGAVMQSPTPFSTLSGTSATFTWSSGSGFTSYELDIGSTYGGNDIDKLQSLSVLSEPVTNLPANGSTIYVTLYSINNSNGQTVQNYYSYVSGP